MTDNATRQPDDWSIEDSAELYRLDEWSESFFLINAAGHLAVQPKDDDPSLTIDIPSVVDEVRRRGIALPVLLRFQDVLSTRVRRLNIAFADAIADCGYGNVYRSVYPIKVNQLHEVVEEVLEAGKPFGAGLECGSKAELVAALPHLVDDEMLLICNGVKDAAMLSLIVSAQRLGKNVIPVMEKYSEFEHLMAIGDQAGVAPQLGARIRLSTSGSGRWAESGGHRSKFGISLPELIRLIEQLEARGRTECFALLHFHLGSQIADVNVLRQAAKEVAQIYAELVRRGIPVRYLDVGGGLGVNYESTHMTDDGGINYSLQEYANAVVNAVQEICEQREVPAPVLVSESGRAITAHHSMLVVETLGAYRKDTVPAGFQLPADSHRVVQALDQIRTRMTPAPGEPLDATALLEGYHEMIQVYGEAQDLFRLGYLPLEQNALAEQFYWSCCSVIMRGFVAAELTPEPVEMRELQDKLVDQYLCDFSVFQSALDHWAIDQVFPIMPLERLHERPDRRALLVDLTCDSDGKIKRYVSSNPDRSFLELHPLISGEPYHLGFFLMGAYQDIMGDAHNLFGRVPEVHVYCDPDEDSGFWIEKVIPGMRVQEMLAQVQYFPNDLERRMNELIKAKIDSNEIRPTNGMAILDQYMAMFDQGTYYDTRRSAT